MWYRECVVINLVVIVVAAAAAVLVLVWVGGMA